MPQVFVSTSAPEGWELGTWREVSPPGTWEEIKGDGTSYKFKSLQMACTPKERRVHLQMSGTSTEVMLLETSAQIFVDGCFFGAYVGRWENVVLDTDAVETVTEVDAANAINAEAPPPMPAKGYEIEAEQPFTAVVHLQILAQPWKISQSQKALSLVPRDAVQKAVEHLQRNAAVLAEHCQ